MLDNFGEKLVIAISSSAMFDMQASHNVYKEKGLKSYSEYQIDNEDIPLDPGEAFPLVKKLLNINNHLKKSNVEVILLSKNSADTGLRVFNSIEHYGLDITRAAFCSGSSPYRYIQAFNCQLFLSTDPNDVLGALSSGVASATILPSHSNITLNKDARLDNQLRFAFDGDAVLFSDEAEKIYKNDGLDTFTKSEKASAKQPLMGGPFKSFLSSLQLLQSELSTEIPLIKTALVTARSAPAHERVIRTLRSWNIRLDESLFLGGMPKVDFLKAYGADIFFDDQHKHCVQTYEHISTGHVPHGVANK